MDLHIFYRISDKGNDKDKLPFSDKYKCLQNAVHVFGKDDFYIIADNCSPETIRFIKNLRVSFEETSLGNSASFIYLIDKIIKNYDHEDAVYLLEDDYIHRGGSKTALLEGLETADYVTLYDHPDKYYIESVNHGNPFNYKKPQRTTVYITDHSHWRETNSTTMTFACRIQTLIEDYPVWRKYLVTKNPKDFYAFVNLTQNNFGDMISFLKRRRRKEFMLLFDNWIKGKKTRRLISPIPAFSTHTEIDFVSPFIDWKSVLQEQI
jgi:hypothetical protein